MRHLPALIKRAGNVTPEVNSVKAEAVINGRTLQQLLLKAHVALALNIQLNLWGLTRSQGSKVNYSLKYGRASWGAKRLLLSLLLLKNTTEWGGGALGCATINSSAFGAMTMTQQ